MTRTQMTSFATLGTSLFFACVASEPGVGVDASAQSAATQVQFDLMHTLPECNHAEKPTTWCDHTDVPVLTEAAGMQARILEILDRAVDPTTSKIRIAYFSFSAMGVFEKLCEKGRAGFDVEGFFDQSYRDKLPARLAAECQGPTGTNVKVRYLGEMSADPFIWRLHHNKLLIVDAGPTEPISINFSSGNLSAFGLSAHFDHWVLMTAPRTSNVAQMHECVLEALRRSLDPLGTGTDQPVDDPSVYRRTLDRCLADNTLYTRNPRWVERALDRENIAPVFSPDPYGVNESVVIYNINEIRSGGRIHAAMQHFLHHGIARALRNAARRGVDVRLVMDDDVITGEGDVPGVTEFYNAYLKQSETGIHVRFLITNAPGFQMMHHKLVIMKNPGNAPPRVFSGAGHFTRAGLGENYENFYLTDDRGLSGKYIQLFNYLWPRTVAEDAIQIPPPGG